VIGTGPTREEAAARLARALDDTVLVGTVTNRDLLVDVLRDEAFLAAATTTAYLDERYPDDAARRFAPAGDVVDLALVAATILAAATRADTAPGPAVRPGFVSAATFDPEVTYTVGDDDVHVRYRYDRDGSVRLWLRDAADPVVATVHGRDADHLHLEVDRVRSRVQVTRRGDVHAVATPGGRVTLLQRPRFPDPVVEQPAGATLAPMPGAVVTVAVTVGERVEAGALLCTVEAMKMEHRVTAPVAGTVGEVHVEPGQQVDADQVLVVVETDGAA
jgi:propionyl-CoA carboxylase alpha chain